MAEAVYRVLQLGQESTVGTAVAATTIYPCEPGSGEFELDRAAESPDEDYGEAERHQAGRGSFGVRLATGSLNSVARFEDIGHLFRMAFGDPTTTGSGPYVHTFGALSERGGKSYTIEVADDTQDWKVKGAVCTQLDLSYDALTAPGNAMWNASATLQGFDKEKATATSSLSAPTTLETMEGHLTTLSLGSTATAFASLTEATNHLKSLSLSFAVPKPPRSYGGSSDVITGWGLGKTEVTFEAQVKESATTTAEYDIFNVSGGLPTDRRWRIAVDGSGNNAMVIDARVRYQSFTIDPDVDGERLYHISGVFVKDATNGSSVHIALTNDVETLP